MVDGRGVERRVVGGIDGGMGLSVDGDCGWWWVCVVGGGWWMGGSGRGERERREKEEWAGRVDWGRGEREREREVQPVSKRVSTAD